jgi:hypothetical protein
MAWLRIDDGFTEHRKLLGLKRSDRWTWVELLTYCARQQNGGTVPENVCDVLRFVTPAFINQCVGLGLIDVEDDGTMVVHNWPKYNPRDPTKADRQARWRANRNGRVDGGVDVLVDGGVDDSMSTGPSTETVPRAQQRAGGPSRPVTTKDPAPPAVASYAPRDMNGGTGAGWEAEEFSEADREEF